ncbi:MAG: Rrf2 family transcriptional regulator [Deltaproteobacteria bacterium]|nr:Rrf2 family transcriptional regulator [Deltaproteobacteria bacterium]
MFRLSRAAEYTIRGVLHLSNAPHGATVDVESVAKAQRIPVAYLAKLFQTLAKKGFVKSTRGPDGGFMLVRDPEDINLLEVIEAVEGPIFLNDCLIHAGQCRMDMVCPVHDVWREAQKRLLEYLRCSTFKGLATAARQKAQKTAVSRES